MYKDLNSLMAEKVRGWHTKVLENTNQFVWMEGRNPESLRMNFDDWKPTEDIRQALDCLDVLRAKDYWVIIVLEEADGYISIYREDPGPSSSAFPVSRETLKKGKEALGVCRAIENLYDE